MQQQKHAADGLNSEEVLSDTPTRLPHNPIEQLINVDLPIGNNSRGEPICLTVNFLLNDYCIRIEKSRAETSFVSVPSEMQSMPVSATSTMFERLI